MTSFDTAPELEAQEADPADEKNEYSTRPLRDIPEPIVGRDPGDETTYRPKPPAE